MRYKSTDIEKLSIGQEYWVAWHFSYQIYRATYLGNFYVGTKKVLFESRHSGISSFTDNDFDLRYICSTEIEARRALIEEIEKTLSDSKAYLRKLVEKKYETTRENSTAPC